MLDRIETNIQVSVAPKSALHDFRSDYLLKVFKYDAATKTFEESALENQIDRDRILADDVLRRDFKAWLLAPDHLREFDRGTVLIPEKFSPGPRWCRPPPASMPRRCSPSSA